MIQQSSVVALNRRQSGQILIVDDDIEMQVLMKEFLLPLGHTVVTYSSAREALDQLASGLSADLIITDINMPNLDGMGFMHHLQGLGIDVPVVVMTAYGSIESAVKSMKAGAQDYLAKPFTP